MDFVIRPEGATRRVELSTQLSVRNRQALKQAIVEEIESGALTWVIDFTRTESIDSSGLGLLVSLNKAEQSQLAADAVYVNNVDRKHYSAPGGPSQWNRPSTDAAGRITLPDLIPGALYRICDFSTVNDKKKGIQIRKDFTVKPGETLDLGDILIEKPQ